MSPPTWLRLPARLVPHHHLHARCPPIHTGFTIGSSLSWGPACKRAYVKTNIDVGYDFKVLGTTLYSDKETLFEQERRAEQDGCPDLPEE